MTVLVTLAGVGWVAPSTSCAPPFSSPGPGRCDPVAAGCEDPLREPAAAAVAPLHNVLSYFRSHLKHPVIRSR